MVIFCLRFWDLRNMGGTELSLTEIQHWRWKCLEKQNKTEYTHTHTSFPPYKEISYPHVQGGFGLHEWRKLNTSKWYLPFLYRADLELPLAISNLPCIFFCLRCIDWSLERQPVGSFSFPVSSLEKPVRGYQWCLAVWSGLARWLHLLESTWQPWWQVVLVEQRPAELPNWC